MSSSTGARSKSNANSNSEMTKANDITLSPVNSTASSNLQDTSANKNEKKKKSILPKIFGSKRNGRGSDEDALRPSSAEEGDGITLERETSPGIEGLNLSNFERAMAPETELQSFRIFVATWNVGGKSPNYDLNLQDFLLVEGSADIYVLGFQEIVPLSAGNVLVIEDNEPAAKWLALIHQALNRPRNEYSDSSDSGSGSKTHSSSREAKSPASLNFFQKPSLKVMSRNFRAEGSSLLKGCNCPVESPSRERRRIRKFSDPMNKLDNEIRGDDTVEELLSIAEIPTSPSQSKYSLISSKQMVGIFLTIWTKKELVPHIGHLRTDSVGRGIMGCLGNKGCISMSMSLHQTSFCFVCSHLASGEKEGDELKRNADVSEILKSTQFPRICKNNPCRRAPDKIVDHECDRILWRGNGIEQLSYIRGESRFSDHRPVCAVFSVDVEVRCRNNRFRKGYSYTSPRLEYEDFIPQRHSFYDF
ncbi:hypothetical protein Fmac_004320 [Flemingia macrophylla]|uniref:Inositol polyphosphate-related phosphatase domain-containing protein n=1 Tax=Flemingia macrophylla TaxID=520843 RepID=A0ABD1N4K7_9FABA